MSRAAWFLLPFLTVFGGGGLLLWSQSEGRPTGEPTAIDFADADGSVRYVRLKGTAHYRSRITQRTPASLIAGEQVRYLFGFFPEGDVDSRAVRVLVRTTREPGRVISFENLTVEGVLRRPDTRTLPPSTEEMLATTTPYWFHDEMLVLHATRVLSEDGEWVEP